LIAAADQLLGDLVTELFRQELAEKPFSGIDL
jgi:hypothetical protein